MCGRVALCDRERARAASGVERECGWRPEHARAPLGSRANASPGCRVTCACVERDARERDRAPGATSCALRELTWGIQRRGGTTDYDRRFNARVEALRGREREDGTAGDAARAAARTDGRAVVYVEGWYEWKEEGPKGRTVKQPYFVRRADGSALALAAVTSRAGDGGRLDEDEDAASTNEAAIVTMPSRGGDIAWLHDRMPLVIASERDFNRWLFEDWNELLSERAAADYDGLFKWYPVSTKINRAAYDGDDAMKPVKREVEKSSGSVADLFAAASAKKRIKVDVEIDGDAADVSVIS